VFVHERPRIGVARHETSSERDGNHRSHGDDVSPAKATNTLARDRPTNRRVDRSDETITVSRHCLQAIRLIAERQPNLSNRVVNALVVFNCRVGPEPRTNRIPADNRIGVFDQQHQQFERLLLQIDGSAVEQ